MTTGTCKLCQRPGMALTRHHVIPQEIHHRVKKKDPKAQVNVVEMICRPCHSHIHSVFTNKELSRTYNTIEKLAAHPDVVKFVGWIQNKRFGAVLYN